MKKKNLILFTLIIAIIILAITGVVAYSFELQNKKDVKENSVPEKDINENSVPDVDETIPGNTDNTDEADNNIPITPEADKKNEETQPGNASTNGSPDESSINTPIVLAFAGDINFNEGSRPMAKYDSEAKGILGGISPELIEEMENADIMMLNNEFTYSLRGKKVPDKQYHFRANPKRVNILKEMGVDIVSLANNHTLDYGMDAFLDTLETLEGAEIDYVGAGINMERAKAPIYYTFGDTKVAYLAASRVVFAMDWYATETRPGMIGTYDPTLILTSVEEAKANSDFVVIYLHWGKEKEHYPLEYQKDLAKKYIDAGADAVIGCHPHVMQGLEFYKGKPIAYSLGNYWFNGVKRETGLLKLYLNPDDTVQVQLLPAMGENTYTYLIQEEAKRKDYYKFMEEISFNVEFDENGYATEKTR
ncbi:CapA family protein [Mobilitalea sibirica]|uniref:CapA family protein n=1 Tax=Mobilitalea sibirica TaxID=1462919 RepID=A0A8J7KX42_9FIRM|nr:CapA family protein [Mobilitalea sibirica]MBH1942070.1 CapA family protein [Mobilitalea sibirica]